MTEDTHRCGYAALVGRPNVGKSTLLNKLLGQKVSITTSKPQTTRHRILGIKTTGDAQVIYVDTPGIDTTHKRAMNRAMNRAAAGAATDVDVVIFMIDATGWQAGDERVLSLLKDSDSPVILAMNKVDRLRDKGRLLPMLDQAMQRMPFSEVVPISARNGDNVAALELAVRKHLPLAPPFYPEDQVTDRSVRFLVAEMIREKLMNSLVDELPYRAGVEIEKFEESEPVYLIHALIWVERDSQKAIVIGKQGALLKKVGTQARIDIEKLLEHRVRLELWVRVREGWSDDERALQRLGYSDET